MQKCADLFCASNKQQLCIKGSFKYNYAKLSYELGCQDEALNSLQSFLTRIPQLRPITKKQGIIGFCSRQYQ